ncbi:MAG: histidine phosphatase family protein [Chloroflexi bacterium]|nr:histidine phosphatase family protein [Chloroflexota bacterium]MCY3582057.1 histidine phosphatase family protein [Chloroflexota bacterium]MCY3715326.1 histidine phosphatase family protein [Chloroflexota bacterium]MDE2649535.1 histidine phosphatase family protein [Chloroflexota bacterium]MXV92943.1 histidine phosphatase family protein [Chloroflexota bacterium]
MTANTMLFIRHAQTDYNFQRRLQGSLPVPLNAAGRAQAQSLAVYLVDYGIDAIYTSPMSRALQTAQILAERLGKIPIQDARLGETAFGCLEGKTVAEAAQHFPLAQRYWQSGYLAYRVPGGESRLDVQQRMRAAWDDILRADAANAIAVVSHGSAIGILLRSLFAKLPETSLRNTSITTLSRHSDIWQIAGYGETPHLR